MIVLYVYVRKRCKETTNWRAQYTIITYSLGFYLLWGLERLGFAVCFCFFTIIQISALVVRYNLTPKYFSIFFGCLDKTKGYLPNPLTNGTSFTALYILLFWKYNPSQNIWRKLKKYSKIGWDFKNVISNFAYFLIVLSAFNFWKEDWALGCVSTHIWHFCDSF